MNRRRFLKRAAILIGGALSLETWPKAAESGPQLSRFDYAALKGDARALAAKAYKAPDGDLPETLAHLSWDGVQAIRFRSTRSLWYSTPSRFRVQFFHRTPLFKDRVRLAEVVNGAAQEIEYDPAMFDFTKAGVQTRLLKKALGFAGFRLHFHTDWQRDVAAFLGASYFRAVSTDTHQYGLSARGLAIDTALESGEEFPIFTEFWLERPQENSDRLTIYALLDSLSVTGAYRFEIVPGPTTVMDVDVALYARKAIERLGIAPLTSMYPYGENDRRMANDWRPEVHDSDGLALLTGAGEWIWRPLVNSTGVRVNSFMDENPRGFGLLQRDRDFDHYQDDGAYYDRRPSLWVEPKLGSGGWQRGAIQLVELPAVDETFDNIVAFWNPDEKPQPGQELLFAYRLHWGTRMPLTPALAQVVATRTGIGCGRPEAQIFLVAIRRRFCWRRACRPAAKSRRGAGYYRVARRN